jgi:hypothetical protein
MIPPFSRFFAFGVLNRMSFITYVMQRCDRHVYRAVFALIAGNHSGNHSGNRYCCDTKRAFWNRTPEWLIRISLRFPSQHIYTCYDN